MDLALLVFCTLALAAIISTKFATRFGLPALVLFVGLGVFAGSDGPIGIQFDDYTLAYNIGIVALATILFSGGLETKMRLFRIALVPASMLATIGTVVTMIVIGLFAWWLTPLDLVTSMLLGAVISSTDAAAVFTSLKGRGLPAKLRGVVETESGANDPVAILLTIALAVAATSGMFDLGGIIIGIVVQLAVGALCGVLLGRAFVWLINSVKLDSFGLYPILGLVGGLLTFALTNIVGGNGFLAAYFAGLVMANARLAHRYNITSFAEATAWGSQILMFLVLGLLVDPSELLVTVPVALLITVVVMFLARPIAVFGTLGLLKAVSLNRNSFAPAEQVLLAWAGLKGAVPIILAIVPLSLGVPGATYIFNVIFVVVIVGTIFQGFTIGPLAQRLGLAVTEPPKSPLRLELGGDAPIGSSVIDVYLGPDSRAVGTSIVDLGLPDDIVIAAVLRRGELVTPRGGTVFEAGDHVYLISPHGTNMGTPTVFLPRRREAEDDGARVAAEMATEPGAGPGAEPVAEPGVEPAAEAGAESGAEPGPGAEPGAEPAAQPSAKASGDPT